jgi:hypothetical protein
MRATFLKIASLFFFTVLLSCNSGNDIKKKELELKEKELELKEKEMQLKADSIKAATDAGKGNKSNDDKANVPETSIEKLLGFWYMPDNSDVNVKFLRDKTFTLNDFNASGTPQRLDGTFELSGSTLTLFYSDRPKQSFKFYKGTGSKYFIENKAVLFVKGENRDN